MNHGEVRGLDDVSGCPLCIWVRSRDGRLLRPMCAQCFSALGSNRARSLTRFLMNGMLYCSHICICFSIKRIFSSEEDHRYDFLHIRRESSPTNFGPSRQICVGIFICIYIYMYTCIYI